MLGNVEPLLVNDCITIKFPEENQNSKLDSRFRLLEISDPHLLETLEQKKEMWIRGGAEDDAVLCSDTQTFRLRELVTSNMFLVIEKSQLDDGSTAGLVVGRPSGTLEAMLMPRPPGIDQLLKALNESLYNGGSVDEEFKGNDLLHVTRIYENVQASAKEIEDCLRQQGVMVIKDHYRKFGNHLLCRFFELFFNTAILEDWNLTDEPINFGNISVAFKQYEDEFSESLTQFILQFYSNSDFKFDFIKVSRFLAEQFLSARPIWDQEDFIKVWDKSLNDLYKPNIETIRDMILIERHPGSGRLEIKKYLRSDLPSDVDSRFIALFKTQARWQYDELMPFIEDLGKDSKELDSIILKHGRVSTNKDIRYITPRSQLLD